MERNEGIFRRWQTRTNYRNNYQESKKELSTIASEIEEEEQDVKSLYDAVVAEEEQDVKSLYDAVVAEAPDYNMDKIKSRLK